MGESEGNVSKLREQFEAWYSREFLTGDESGYMFMRRHDNADAYIHIRIQEQWISYQAGHAASGREELLEALEGVMGSIEAYEAGGKPEIEWDEYDHMMIPKWRAAFAAIKKARGEK